MDVGGTDEEEALEKRGESSAEGAGGAVDRLKLNLGLAMTVLRVLLMLSSRTLSSCKGGFGRESAQYSAKPRKSHARVVRTYPLTPTQLVIRYPIRRFSELSAKRLRIGRQRRQDGRRRSDRCRGDGALQR